MLKLYNYKDVDFSDNNNFNFSPNFDIFAINVIACNKWAKLKGACLKYVHLYIIDIYMWLWVAKASRGVTCMWLAQKQSFEVMCALKCPQMCAYKITHKLAKFSAIITHNHMRFLIDAHYSGKYIYKLLRFFGRNLLAQSRFLQRLNIKYSFYKAFNLSLSYIIYTSIGYSF